MVIELVELKINADVSDEHFVEAAEKATVLLKSLPGFIGRRLAKGADETWIDCVEWRSMKEALEAAAIFSREPAAKPFNAAIASGSVRMRHFSVQAST